MRPDPRWSFTTGDTPAFASSVTPGLEHESRFFVTLLCDGVPVCEETYRKPLTNSEIYYAVRSLIDNLTDTLTEMADATTNDKE
jgi:hypothetical protein